MFRDELGEGMELKIDPRWKWAAMDKDGSWTAYEVHPKMVGSEWVTNFTDCSGHISLAALVMPECPCWADSLHEIKDGRLVKYIDIPADGEPVIAGKVSRKRRYSAGRLNCHGHLLCYEHGGTRWSSKGVLSAWEEWTRPTPEELQTA